jgi:hypothetical protein
MKLALAFARIAITTGCPKTISFASAARGGKIMSVLIKGFNLPKDGCKDCAMVKRGFVSDTCPFLKQEVSGNVERGGKPYGCPLIEVSDINAGDTIYRQAAIDAVIAEGRTVDSHYLESERIIHVDDAVEAISMLPSAQPRQTCEYWDSESNFCALCRPSAQPETPMQIGWICPVCGRGLSPLTSVCPCNNGKGWEITC